MKPVGLLGRRGHPPAPAAEGAMHSSGVQLYLRVSAFFIPVSAPRAGLSHVSHVGTLGHLAICL